MYVGYQVIAQFIDDDYKKNVACWPWWCTPVTSEPLGGRGRCVSVGSRLAWSTTERVQASEGYMLICCLQLRKEGCDSFDQLSFLGTDAGLGK